MKLPSVGEQAWVEVDELLAHRRALVSFQAKPVRNRGGCALVEVVLRLVFHDCAHDVVSPTTAFHLRWTNGRRPCRACSSRSARVRSSYPQSFLASSCCLSPISLQWTSSRSTISSPFHWLFCYLPRRLLPEAYRHSRHLHPQYPRKVAPLVPSPEKRTWGCSGRVPLSEILWPLINHNAKLSGFCPRLRNQARTSCQQREISNGIATACRRASRNLMRHHIPINSYFCPWDRQFVGLDSPPNRCVFSYFSESEIRMNISINSFAAQTNARADHCARFVLPLFLGSRFFLDWRWEGVRLLPFFPQWLHWA